MEPHGLKQCLGLLPKTIKCSAARCSGPHFHNYLNGCSFGNGLGKIFYGCSLKIMVPRSWDFLAEQKSEIPVKKSEIFLKCKSPHLSVLINVWHIWKIDLEKLITTNPIWDFLRKLLTCYQPDSLKTLSERGCTGFTLSPNLEAAGKLGGQPVWGAI